MTPSARLRAAGYLPLPRLWVTREDMDLIMWMARKHEKDVSEIRAGKGEDAQRSDGGN